MVKLGKDQFLRLLQEKDAEGLFKLLRGLGGEWVVQSNPFRCLAGFSKISLKRKRGRSGGITCSYCFPDYEAEKIKNQIRELLKSHRILRQHEHSI
jgi:hypothetical protein